MTIHRVLRGQISAFAAADRKAGFRPAFSAMSLFLLRPAGVAGLVLFVFLAVPVKSASGQNDFKVSVTKDEIRFRWEGKGDGTVGIVALPLATGQKSPALVEPQRAAGEEVWRGSESAAAAAIPRFNGARDRLFAKYQLVSRGVNVSDAAAQHVTEFGALARRTHLLGSSASKKGVTCLLDPADGVALGCAQLNQNIDIAGLLDLQSPAPKLEFTYEGRQIGLRPAAVARLDAELKTARKNGQRVTGILLNNVRSTTSPSSPLVHPLTDPSRVPIGPSAFNTATEEGVFYYRAIVHWLVERYTREDAEFGWLSGLVVGNEMQSHWSWYHLGHASRDVVISEYSAALRVVDLVARSLHAGFQTYVSLEHHWAMPASEDPKKGFSGLEALEGIQRISLEGGNFPWSLAFHPYPENLFKPEFWKDRSAPMRFDAPRITFKNLEVLPAFLRQPDYLFEGKPRTIALTEQGFHCPDGDEGEQLQAAAYAFAWKKVQAIPEIESFLYHRHVDHPHEHGLRCGMRAHDGSANVNGVGGERALWKVFQSAGTEQEDAACAFALPIIGRADWSNVVSSSVEPSRRKISESGAVVYDFVLSRDSASRENVQDVARKMVGPEDEVRRPALLEHPMAKGRGRLAFRVELPPEEKGECVLAFEALLNHPKSTGAAFRVEVDGREMFARTLGGGEQIPAEIPLNEWRGSEVLICFEVDALKDSAYDWTTWVAPRVLLRVSAKK